MYEFLCRINPQRDIWTDVECDVTRLIVRRLFNFKEDSAIFCDVRFCTILEKVQFWLRCNVETNRVCSKIAIFSVELCPIMCWNKNSCLTVIAKTSLILVLFDQNCAKNCAVLAAVYYTVLFLVSTLNNSNAHFDAFCCFSTPQFTQPLNLMRVSCVFLALGKLGYGEVFSFLMKGDWLSFSSHLKCRQEETQ